MQQTTDDILNALNALSQQLHQALLVPVASGPSMAERVQDFFAQWATVLTVLFMAAIVFVLWRTLKVMPKTKPVQIKPQANLEVGWDDIAGVDEAKYELQEVVEFLRDEKRFKRLGAKVPKGVLLHGPPGTGKTLLAKAVAQESGAQFFSQSASSFVEMFAGLGAARIRRLFSEARKHSPAIIFICPYGTSISTLRWAIQRLCRAGYHVIAYETTTAVFMAADPAILRDLISAMRKDLESQISRLRSEGVTEFGFFGSSLGSFILYNCIGDAIPALRWGVFNTGGDIAQGMWRLDGARQQHVRHGWSLPRLEAAWADLQWPQFGRLDGCRFVFVSSRRDTIAPLDDIAPYLGPMRQAGAQVCVLEVRAIGHLTTIVAGLWQAPRIIARLRS